ncbi:MAG TPA: hypothetical protein VE476_16730, partial [Propionibacteriaceae bacterium]|nr:hypothetical protein [Propionibacteriaceae bacterium]
MPTAPPTSSSYLVAGALTARLAERHSGRPSLTLAGIGVVLGTVGTVTQDVTPPWFSVALLVLGPPIVGVGGRMALRRSVRRRPVRR